jgi:hypothetical protein
MSHRPWSRLLPLLVILSLLASPVLALGGDPARHERDPGIVYALWQFLGSLVRSFEHARGTMDPNGQPSSVESDAHGTMDPNG